MSIIKISCTSCGKKLEVPENVLGKSVQCSVCGTVFQAVRPPSVVEKSRGTAVKIVSSVTKFLAVVCILALLAIIGTAVWVISSVSQQRDDTAKNHIRENYVTQPLEIADVDLHWEKVPGNFDVLKAFWGNTFASEDEPPINLSASGNFAVKANVKEKLYQSVSHQDGLQELKILDTYEKEHDDAKEKLRKLPASVQNDLSKAAPKDISLFQFYKLLVVAGEEVALTGEAALIKLGKEKWERDRIQVDPFPFGNTFTPESKLQGAHKLDDPATKQSVEAIIQARRDFAVDVDSKYDEWSFDKALREGLSRATDGRSLKMIGEITKDSVDWTSKTKTAVSGKFTLKTQTTEKLYQSIDKKTGLERLEFIGSNKGKAEELGVTEIYEKEVYAENALIPSGFYDLVLPSGSDITLTGIIKLTKQDSGDWQVDNVQPDPTPAGNGVAESRLPNDAYKLDDPKTKESIGTIVKDFVDFMATLIKQKDDFDKFCNGKKYTGDLRFRGGTGNVVSFAARVDFKEAVEPNTNEVEGTITIESPAWKGGRPFTVSVNTEKVVDDNPVYGTIDNSMLPGWDTFWGNVKDKVTKRQDADDCRSFYNLLRDNVKIAIKFPNNKMSFSLTNRHDMDGALLYLAETRTDAKDAATGPENRDWILPAVKKWVADHAGTMRKTEPTHREEVASAPRQTGNPDGAVDLYEELRRRGFSGYDSLKDFARYGSAKLRDRQFEAKSNRRNVDKFDDNGIVNADAAIVKADADIKKEIASIPQKAFYADYTYTVHDSKNDGDGSSNFSMGISTDIRHPKIGDVAFPFQDVRKTSITSYWGGSGMILSVSGNTANIGELVNNKDNYRVRVFFRNLQFNNDITADVSKVEIIKKDRSGRRQ